jgi:hypothetical protein
MISLAAVVSHAWNVMSYMISVLPLTTGVTRGAISFIKSNFNDWDALA